MIPSAITARHVQRRAVTYLRQSSPGQVEHNTGSTAVQRDLPIILQQWGWSSDRIDTIDADLGVSGSVANLRPGFQRLIDAMKTGQVGLVLVSDLSRLGRNYMDLAVFMTTARQHDVLVAHGQQVVDLRDPNAEFTTLILQFNAVRENRTRVDQGIRAKLKKAQAGVAITRPPVGYVVGASRAWLKDPDGQVRDAVQMVIDQFLALGTLGRVVRHLVNTGARLPHRGPMGQLGWATPTRWRVYRLLTHPAYAGFYVYGRTAVDGTRSHYANGHPVQVRRTMGDWILVPDHHEGYMTAAEWTTIQERLAGNRNTRRWPLGRGEALLQGLVRCAVHERGFHTSYPYSQSGVRRGTRLARYGCHPNHEQTQSGGCVTIRARELDALVEQALFRVLEPATIEQLSAMGREALRDHEARVRARAAELRQAEQHVQETDRQLDHTPVDHGLVRQRLSQRLEDQLRALRDLRATHDLYPLVPPLVLDAAELVELQDLVTDLPTLWRHPAVEPVQRKALVRLLIRHVTVTPTPGAWSVTIGWVGNAETTQPFITARGVRDLVAEACAEGLGPEAIADRLHAHGAIRRLGSRTGQDYSPRAVRNLMTKTGIPLPIDRRAYEYIAARLAAHASHGMILAELIQNGLPHPLGQWTKSRLQTAIERLRAGRVPGLPPIPPPVSLKTAVVTLHDTGVAIPAIVDQLNQAGLRTLQGRPLTYYYVWAILRDEGRRPAGVAHQAAFNAWLTEWAPQLPLDTLVARANALGFVTRAGNLWKAATLERKLVSRGLSVRRDSGACKKAST